ncbi:MAG: Eco57I restriction-modification methylase domain-containing protein [Novosphingobium sp.]|uniref:Eco57I restriction-modification methylase domain-containing protein n=1 Tax=Novosphingobium sp. TaxID=1874826 RepID=UPI00301AFE0C
MLTAQLDQTRLDVSPTLDPKKRSKLGQFMTPGKIAEFMASKFGELPDDVRLLDAGAGMGALTAAFVLEACKRTRKPKSIDVTAYEVDPSLAVILRETLAACADQCAEIGIAFQSRVMLADYILDTCQPLLAERRAYNCVILNPPYAKIGSGSDWRAALRTLGIETVNLYTAFVGLAVLQMERGGELVAITPRSFCNGPYYQPIRDLILGECALQALHVFEDRRTTFKDDDVLQENLIFQLRKDGDQGTVRLSTDAGMARDVAFAEIVSPQDRHRFIRLPVAGNDLAQQVQALPCRLVDLGIAVSTGRVVDFRAKEHLRKMPGVGTVPLIYPAHFENGRVGGAISDFKKHNALADNPATASLIVPGGTYVLTKRFSAKEEKRRLVAAIYEGGRVGFENHLNYFHAGGRGLPQRLALGLAAYLNSEAVDEYFRTFSGHTQVNATDLRNLHYPTIAQLEALADAADIDAAVRALL